MRHNNKLREMAFQLKVFHYLPLLYIFFIAFVLVFAICQLSPNSVARNSFPADFIFGAATSAYQTEGAADEDGRGSSIWDTFCSKNTGNIVDGSNGTVAADSYHHVEEDVQLLKQLGVNAYSFSISWSRILPNGKITGGINQQGVAYYNRLLHELKSNGIEPYVTIFHWDLPQALEDEYGGFLSPLIVDDFKNYANVCFAMFGDKVQNWITLNEPWTFSVRGYSSGVYAPGRCSGWKNSMCSMGNSGTEPYITAHHQLLAHAAVVKLYRDNYQVKQNGKIGITLNSQWFVPYSNSKEDGEAATRSLDFMFGWFMEPITYGDYPSSMRALVLDRLPQITKEQSEMLKGSYDFLGLNYYTSNYAKNLYGIKANFSYETDGNVCQSGSRHGTPIGPQAASEWLFIYPRGLKELLIHVKKRYDNPVIFLTENGVDEVSNATIPLENALKDDARIEYYKQHLESLNMAIREGANVKGYFARSLLDNFEWVYGYTIRFGLYYVDYKTLQRFPKASAIWFQNFLKPTKMLARKVKDYTIQKL